MNIRLSRRGRLFYCLISVLTAFTLSTQVARAQGPALTTINDVVYRADGTPAAGQLVITWPAFTTADNKPVAAGEKTVTLGADGALNVQLAPNEGATPAGSYYKVVYKLTNGASASTTGSSTTATEYWTVPAASPPGSNVTIGAIRATVVPAQVAAQLVTRQYVDQVVGVTGADVVHRSSDESITGVKTFTVSPLVPTPGASGEAANKSYVDAQTAPILRVQPDSGAANNFLTGITGAGVITKAQPAFANLSGSLACSQAPALSGDITSSAGTCATTYATTVPATKGGTGQTVYTKGDLLAASSASTLSKVAVGSDGQVLAADSSQPTGVRWTNSSAASTLLDHQNATSTLAGDDTDKTFYTFTMPAGTLGPGKGVRIFLEAQHATGSGLIVYKLWFGSTVVATASATSSGLLRMGAYILNDPDSATSQQSMVYELVIGSVGVSPPTTPATSAEDTTNSNIVIKATFSGPATDTVAPKIWVVEALR